MESPQIESLPAATVAISTPAALILSSGQIPLLAFSFPLGTEVIFCPPAKALFSFSPFDLTLCSTPVGNDRAGRKSISLRCDNFSPLRMTKVSLDGAFAAFESGSRGAQQVGIFDLQEEKFCHFFPARSPEAYALGEKDELFYLEEPENRENAVLVQVSLREKKRTSALIGDLAKEKTQVAVSALGLGTAIISLRQPFLPQGGEEPQEKWSFVPYAKGVRGTSYDVLSQFSPALAAGGGYFVASFPNGTPVYDAGRGKWRPLRLCLGPDQVVQKWGENIILVSLEGGRITARYLGGKAESYGSVVYEKKREEIYTFEGETPLCKHYLL